jgi:8-oxo-dGTP pyrophosphatase MutT (NUDIX family)
MGIDRQQPKEPLPKVFGNAGSLVKFHNLLLMVKIVACNKWDVPSGKPLPHETADQTAIRETYEETGLKITPLRLVEDFGGEFYLYESIILNPEFDEHSILQPPIEYKDEINEAKFCPIEALNEHNVRYPHHLGRIKELFNQVVDSQDYLAKNY